MREGIPLDIERQLLKKQDNINKLEQQKQLTEILQTSRDLVDSVNKK